MHYVLWPVDARRQLPDLDGGPGQLLDDLDVSHSCRAPARFLKISCPTPKVISSGCLANRPVACPLNSCTPLKICDWLFYMYVHQHVICNWLFYMSINMSRVIGFSTSVLIIILCVTGNLHVSYIMYDMYCIIFCMTSLLLNLIITISDFFTDQFLSNMENELQLQNQNKTKKRWTDNSGIIWPYETLQWLRKTQEEKSWRCGSWGERLTSTKVKIWH